MIIPYEELSTEALRGLIEEFVTRPGTDTGYTEGSLEENVEMVMMQLTIGDVLVVYDAALQTANLIHKDKMKAARKIR